MSREVVKRCVVILSLILTSFICGCHSIQPSDPSQMATSAKASDPYQLKAGDTIQVTFPGAPDLNTTQQIRSDGLITLPALGQFKASMHTPGSMEQELIRSYGSQLLTQSASVTLLSAHFPVYVSGAVRSPGKIVSDHPLSALDAIMEAGGFDFGRANLRRVTVIRHSDQEGSTYDRYILDLESIFGGQSQEIFALKPNDTIHVPEKFEWF